MCSETEALEKSVEDLASGSLFLIQDSRIQEPHFFDSLPTTNSI